MDNTVLIQERVKNMAQNQTFLFKQEVTARSIGYHIAGGISAGVYEGMMVVPTSPRTMKVGMTAGFAYTDEGVKITEYTPIGIEQEAVDAETFLEIDPVEDGYARKDLIVMRHRLKTYAPLQDPSEDPNVATYHVIKGAPVDPNVQNPEIPELQAGDVPMAVIDVRPNMEVIDEDDIFNYMRTMNSEALVKYLSESLYIGLGNFVFEGWDIEKNALNISISPGSGLIGGIKNSTDHTVVCSTIRAQEYLRHPRFYNNDTGLYDGDECTCENGSNLNLFKQMDYPTVLEIRITPVNDPIPETPIYLTGLDGDGNVINAEEVKIMCPEVGQQYSFFSTSKFARISNEGIDAHLVGLVDPQAKIEILDKPVAHIYVVGNDSGRPSFDVTYRMDKVGYPNRYYLGYAESDMIQVTNIYQSAKGAFKSEEEDLSSQATGINRVFTLRYVPEENSEMFVIDGLVLKRNSAIGKGYTINGSVITLQENVTPPDGSGNYYGNGPTEVWIRYNRKTQV